MHNRLVNIYLFSEVQKHKNADIKQEKIFIEVADSLTYFRMQRDSLRMSTLNESYKSRLAMKKNKRKF